MALTHLRVYVLHARTHARRGTLHKRTYTSPYGERPRATKARAALTLSTGSTCWHAGQGWCSVSARKRNRHERQREGWDLERDSRSIGSLVREKVEDLLTGSFLFNSIRLISFVS